MEGYRAAWRAKVDEVNACIAANAEQEELVDQPEIDRKITRVSGPFTVEAVQPPEMSLNDGIEVDTGFAGEPDELEESFALSGKIVVRDVQMGESAQNVEAYLSKMVDLLRMDGVRFPDNKHLKFTRLDAIYATGSSSGIHAEGRWVNAGESDGEPEGPATVGVVFGPQYGPITAKMIEEVIKPAARRYDDLVFAGFSFDGPAQAVIDEGVPHLRLHLAHIRPDVNPRMNGLLKEQPGSQLFTVFGRPGTKLDGPDADGMFTLEMEGVDIYDPVTNSVADSRSVRLKQLPHDLLAHRLALHLVSAADAPEHVPVSHAGRFHPGVDGDLHRGRHRNRAYAPVLAEEVHDAPAVVALLYVLQRKRRHFRSAQPAAQ